MVDKRKSVGIRVFSALIALILILAGFSIMGGALDGTGPCGRFCGVMASMLNLLGQTAYNITYGMLLVIVGLSFAVLPYIETKGGNPDAGRRP